MTARAAGKPKSRQTPRAGEAKRLDLSRKRRTGATKHKPEASPRSRSRRSFWRDNGLSLAFIALFVLCFFGQALSGYLLQFENPAARSSVHGFLGYFTTATFLEGAFSNWQAAVLQLLVLIVFSMFLRQRGAAHSRKPEALPKGGRPQGERRAERQSPWIYRNSLSLAFTGLFVISFVAHFLSGATAYNEERARLSEQPLSLLHFLVSAKFWFSTLQTWQAEFFAISAFLLLSVWLRQERSAESKPVGASEDETGDVNE